MIPARDPNGGEMFPCSLSRSSWYSECSVIRYCPSLSGIMTSSTTNIRQVVHFILLLSSIKLNSVQLLAYYLNSASLWLMSLDNVGRVRWLRSTVSVTEWFMTDGICQSREGFYWHWTYMWKKLIQDYMCCIMELGSRVWNMRVFKNTAHLSHSSLFLQAVCHRLWALHFSRP